MPQETVATLMNWLDVCLRAAREAEGEAYLHDYPIEEFGDRNEPWYHGHILHRLNDELRRHYGTGASKAIHVMPEAKVSWLHYQCYLRKPDGTRTVTGRPVEALSGSQRIDLAVWDTRWVRGLIEVKNAPGMDQNRARVDAMRIDQALRIWGDTPPTKLRWGMIITCERLSNAQARDDAGRLKALRARVNERVQGIKQACPNRTLKHALEPDPKTDSHSLWWGMLIR